jgi:hypothetical protein
MMKIRHLWILVFGVWAMVLAPQVSLCKETAPQKPIVEYRTGRVTLKGKKVPVLDLIEPVSQLAGVRVILFDYEGKLPEINVDLSDKPLGEALRVLLGFCNHMVVFRAENPGVTFMPSFTAATKRQGPSAPKPEGEKASGLQHENAGGNDSEPEADAGMAEDTSGPADSKESTGETPTEPLTDFVRKENRILGRMAMTEHRIESGESDRHYEHWSQYRDPRYLVHDREHLEHYREKLDDLYEVR